ncbi:MAG: zinc-binding alcohol dehydrogenase family protein, partial [Solirubrobacteraceae bacterium]|nr:zinc-binding alcohol dehydrogenase family protein [Solirubrobacteraceae bacterium]
VLLDEEQSFALAADTDPLAAISCGIAGLAAWLSVTDRGRIQEGDKVVVTGATGASGRLAIQIAKLRGASQIIAIGRDAAGLQRARELGATDVIRFHGPMHAHQTELEHLSDGGHDLIIDFTWGYPAMSAIMSAAKGARLVQVGNAASVGLGVTASDLRARQLDLLGFSIFNVPLVQRERAFNELLGHVESGEIQLDTEAVALDDVPQAWARQGSSPGTKLVVAVGS